MSASLSEAKENAAGEPHLPLFPRASAGTEVTAFAKKKYLPGHTNPYSHMCGYQALLYRYTQLCWTCNVGRGSVQDSQQKQKQNRLEPPHERAPLHAASFLLAPRAHAAGAKIASLASARNSDLQADRWNIDYLIPVQTIQRGDTLLCEALACLERAAFSPLVKP